MMGLVYYIMIMEVMVMVMVMVIQYPLIEPQVFPEVEHTHLMRQTMKKSLLLFPVQQTLEETMTKLLFFPRQHTA